MPASVTAVTQVQPIRSDPSSGAEVATVGRKDPELLSGEQQTALAELAKGQTFKDAAQAAGVHRVTVYRWMKSHAAFRAAYNAWEQEVRESARSRLLAAAENAVEYVISNLKYDKKMAFQLLKELGIFRPRRGRNIDEVNLVRREIELREMEVQRRLDRRLARASARKPTPDDPMPSIQTLRKIVRERLGEGDDDLAADFESRDEALDDKAHKRAKRDQ